MAAVGGGSCHLAKGGIIGNGQGSVAQNRIKSLVFPVLVLGKGHQISCDQVGVIIIIAVLGSVQAVCADLLIAFKIRL